MIMDTVSHIKKITYCEINELVDKNMIREIIIEENDEISIHQIEKLFKCFLVMYLYLDPPKLMSCSHESITSKKYLLGYRGIRSSFNHDRSIDRYYFMKVSSCYLEANFFYCKGNT